MATAIGKRRQAKMQGQGGLCHYCGQPMWTDDPDAFCATHGVPRRKARLFQCTAEHLRARSDGGSEGTTNIVAACLFCNQTRHKAKRPLDPPAYRSRVRRRLDAGRWLRL
jgi:hypothetical protein